MYPYALLHMTGSDHFNRSLRKFAWIGGYSLSDHGLFQVIRIKEAGGKTSKHKVGTVRFPAKTEEDIFKLLHMPYVEPHDRHSNFACSLLAVEGEQSSAGAGSHAAIEVAN